MEQHNSGGGRYVTAPLPAAMGPATRLDRAIFCNTIVSIVVGEVKVFGAALDALDSPERVALKRAWMEALARGQVGPAEPLDPYEAIAPLLANGGDGPVDCGGKVEIHPSLTPRPPPSCLHEINSDYYRSYIDGNLQWKTIRQCRRFIERSIFPSIPGMFAVDHSLSAANFQAISKFREPDDIALIILDSHFDAIPADIRAPSGTLGTHLPDNDSIHCGNFIERMIDEKIARPENIIVIGPSDYPPEEEPGEDDSLRRYREAYLSFEEKGVKLFSKSMARTPSFLSFLDFLLEDITAPFVYVSMDADIGAGTCMNAVRFLDTVGLNEEIIMGIAATINKHLTNGRLSLAGFDVSEVDAHLLGLPGPDGRPDRTAEACARFVKTLLGCQ